MAAPNYRYRLKKNHGKILRDIEPRKIVNILYQDDVFDLEDMDDVRSEKSRKRQAEVLLDKVTRSGDGGIAIFVNALWQTQRHLYQLLQEKIQGEEIQAQIDAQVQASSGSGNMGIANITNQMAVTHVHEEHPTYINKDETDSTRITKHNFTRTVIQDGGKLSDMRRDHAVHK
ncbi:hypothetical protein ACROYT_G023930 [Oculina patagonica]